jgi:hypothetical protein
MQQSPESFDPLPPTLHAATLDPREREEYLGRSSDLARARKQTSLLGQTVGESIALKLCMPRGPPKATEQTEFERASLTFLIKMRMREYS